MPPGNGFDGWCDRMLLRGLVTVSSPAAPCTITAGGFVFRFIGVLVHGLLFGRLICATSVSHALVKKTAKQAVGRYTL
jgi:hypothetical protein